MIELQPFQRRFLRASLKPSVDTAALSIPRGNGKSWIAAYIMRRCLTPGDDLFQAGAEYLLGAGSMEQARIVFRFIRSELEPTGEYRFIDSVTRLGIRHKPTNTRLKVQSSNAKTAFGIVGCPLAVLDEPGSWEVVGGELMNDALQTAQGKPGSPLKLVYIGTLAPAKAGWWHDLVAGGKGGSVYVQAIQGRRDRWDSWREVLRCNPLAKVDANFKRKLREELEAAKRDTRLKARFMSYRLNLPTSDESETLLTVEDWELAARRPVPERDGRPIVGVDLGGGRSWSAAVAAWKTSRIEAMAVAPGIPDLSVQEKRDNLPGGTYVRLAEAGVLEVAEGLHVQPPGVLWQSVVDRWGIPASIICDRFRLPELLDVIQGACSAEPRVTRWSEAAFDIRALRKFVRDGPFGFATDSQPIIAASLTVSNVQNDDQGNTRLTKNAKRNAARDDVAAALCLVAGAFERASAVPETEGMRFALA